MEVQDREISKIHRRGIQMTVPDAGGNPTDSFSKSADGYDGWSFSRGQGLSFVFRANDRDGELVLEDSDLFSERFQEIKKNIGQDWQKQQASTEARKGTNSAEELAMENSRIEEWAIKVLVNRELERQKLAKNEASRVIWPPHRKAAEQLAREQLAEWRIGKPRLFPLQQRGRNEDLVQAVRRGLVGEVKLLLHNGADVEYTQNHYEGTALHVAARQGHQEIISLLLKADSNINALNSSLETPLDVAATNPHLGGVQTLLTAIGWANVDGGGGNIWDHRCLPLRLLAVATYPPSKPLSIATRAENGTLKPHHAKVSPKAC